MQRIGSNDSLFQRALVSGTVAGLTSAAAATLAGWREVSAPAAPLNATSHIVFGDDAARQQQASAKFTGTGFLLNHAAALLWAAVYEKWFARRRESALSPLLGAAAVTAGAYVTDYYLVPKRFTPGYEKRVSGTSMVMIYGALALGMWAGSRLVNRNGGL